MSPNYTDPVTIPLPIDRSDPRGVVAYQRLLLCKRLYLHGIEHSRRGNALDKMVAVHHLHNAVEIALRAIFLHYEIRPEKQMNLDFESMMREIDQFEPFANSALRLPYRQEMRNLNNVRNLVQHHGTEPADAAMDDWRVFSHRFLDRVFEDYFVVRLDDVSGISLVHDDRLRGFLERAERSLAEGDGTDTSRAAQVAFLYAMASVEQHYPVQTWASDSFIRSDLRRLDFFEVTRILEKIYERIHQVEGYAAILATGVSPGDFNKLLRLPPRSIINDAGTEFSDPTGPPCNESDARWAVNFVTDCVIKWQLQGLQPSVPDHMIDVCDKYLAKGFTSRGTA